MNPNLIDDVLIEIFRFLNHNELGRVRRVCKKWNSLSLRPTFSTGKLVIFEHRSSFTGIYFLFFLIFI